MPANLHQLPAVESEQLTETTKTNGNHGFVQRRRTVAKPGRRPPAAFHLAATPGSQPMEPLLSVKDAAFLLGLSVKTLRDWIQARKIDYVKLGTRVMIRPETVREFVTKNTRAAAV